MPIDITNNVVFDSGSGGLEPSKKPDSDGSAQPRIADSTLRAEYESIIRNALDTADTDSQVVTDARGVLETGLLDTTQAAQSAAERILTLGI